MKSKIRLIIIIAVVALLLGGAVLALKLTAPESEPEEETAEAEVTSSLLYDKNPDDILSIRLNVSERSFSIYGWCLNIWKPPLTEMLSRSFVRTLLH